MQKTETAFGALPSSPAETKKTELNSDNQYSPGEFLKQSGFVVAACLGLAVLAQVLVAFVGVY